MTGYSKVEKNFENKIVSIELKSVNSKQCDVNIKLPNIYRCLEIKIINIIKDRLHRGKIDCIITITNSKDSSALNINQELFKSYYSKLKTLTSELQADSSCLTQYLLSREDINQLEDENLNEEESLFLLSCVNEATNALDNYRQVEGEALLKAFNHHIDLIEKYSLEVSAFETNRIPAIKEKLMHRFQEMKVEMAEPVRFEQELIFYLEKLDITEEKVRLHQHITYFRQCMQEEEIVGKKLGFIAQEMGREINTLGSKSNEFNMQQLVVKMKDELEKIKEQVANVL